MENPSNVDLLQLEKNDHIPSCCIRVFNTRHLLKTFTNSRKSSWQRLQKGLQDPDEWMNVNPPSSRVTSEIMRLRTYHRYIHVVLAVHHLFITPSCSPQRHHLPNQKKTSIWTHPSSIHLPHFPQDFQNIR